MTSHEDQLREALSSPIKSGVLEVFPSDSDVTNGLERSFPFAGSKIDWDAVRGHSSTIQTESGHQEFRDFFDARRRELGGDRAAFYVNDALLDCAARASLFTFQRHLDSILSIPGHHYFVAEDFSWCIAYTMEGDIDFGWSA
jgi:hypothetical protein